MHTYLDAIGVPKTAELVLSQILWNEWNANEVERSFESVTGGYG